MNTQFTWIEVPSTNKILHNLKEKLALKIEVLFKQEMHKQSMLHAEKHLSIQDVKIKLSRETILLSKYMSISDLNVLKDVAPNDQRCKLSISFVSTSVEKLKKNNKENLEEKDLKTLCTKFNYVTLDAKEMTTLMKKKKKVRRGKKKSKLRNFIYSSISKHSDENFEDRYDTKYQNMYMRLSNVMTELQDLEMQIWRMQNSSKNVAKTLLEEIKENNTNLYEIKNKEKKLMEEKINIIKEIAILTYNFYEHKIKNTDEKISINKLINEIEALNLVEDVPMF